MNIKVLELYKGKRNVVLTYQQIFIDLQGDVTEEDVRELINSKFLIEKKISKGRSVFMKNDNHQEVFDHIKELKKENKKFWIENIFKFIEIFKQ